MKTVVVWIITSTLSGVKLVVLKDSYPRVELKNCREAKVTLGSG